MLSLMYNFSVTRQFTSKLIGTLSVNFDLQTYLTNIAQALPQCPENLQNVIFVKSCATFGLSPDKISELWKSTVRSC